MLAILVVFCAMLFVGMVLFAGNHVETKRSAVPVRLGPQIGDLVQYSDKRTGNFRGYARVERFRRDGLVTLRHGPWARQFSVHPTRIQERS